MKWRILLLLAGAALGCAPKNPPPTTVVLISIDTLRPDHLGCYGYKRPTSPTIDAFASESALFLDASSPSPWTLPAHASLLTGLYPSRHGLKSHEAYLPAAIETLASRLVKRGYATAAVVNSQNLSSRFGLDRGFQQFRYVEEVAAQREPSRGVTDQAAEWLRQHAGRRLFLFVHYYDVHSDYASRPEYEAPLVAPYRGRADGTTGQLMSFREGRVSLASSDAPHLVDLYDAGIRQMDDELARLLASIDAHTPRRQSLVILTSDHGEEFFEHGGVLHGRTQFQEVMRVPLLVRGPGISAGHRITTPVSLLDVLPSVLRRLGESAPAGLDGNDISALFASDSNALEGRTLFGEADHGNTELDMTRAVRRGRFKLHYDRVTKASALFDLSKDPSELSDVSAREGETLRDLQARLERFLEIQPAAATPLKLSPEEMEKLRSLGYIR